MNSELDLGTFEMNFSEKQQIMAQQMEIKKTIFKPNFFPEIYNL